MCEHLAEHLQDVSEHFLFEHINTLPLNPNYFWNLFHVYTS